jgi:ZIP family zinc transporter
VSEAIGLGALAASSLIVGALLGLARPWPDRLVGLVLAFGAGALISAVSFDLAQEGSRVGDPGVGAVGLAVGAITYFALNRLAGRRSRHGNGAGAGEDTGTALALGGVPRRHPRADRPRHRNRVRRGGKRRTARRDLRLQPPGGDRVCLGYAVADSVSGNLNAAIDGFAAGALLVMLIDSLIPDAVRKGGDVSGLVTVLGFAVAAGLSAVS